MQQLHRVSREHVLSRCGTRFGITASPATASTNEVFCLPGPVGASFGGVMELYCGNSASRSVRLLVGRGGSAGQRARPHGPATGPRHVGLPLRNAHGAPAPQPQPQDP